jgi:catechol 2,3-dioxygenase-like lactoylglutathione lyase family enzyme
MAYVLGPDLNHPAPSLKRLDHIICQVPDIEKYHRHWTDVLGFSEAWPVGRFWPDGRTSGIVLGGINLELIQADGGALDEPLCDCLVFEPTSIDQAEVAFLENGIEFEKTDKWEANPELLALRGFQGPELEREQLICRNIHPRSSFPVSFFLCQYSERLRELLAPSPLFGPYGRVVALEIQLPERGDIWRLGDFGYVGDIEFFQDEVLFGPPKVTGIKFEAGIPDSGGLPIGLRFI